MTESLRIELNGDGLHSISAPPSFSAAGGFDVVLENTGQPVHVHLHLDDELSRVARLDGGNHYVEGEETQRVGVRTAPGSDAASGRLKIVTGYGAETTYVDVTVEPTPETQDGIEVGEELSRPPTREPDPSLVEEVIDSLPSRATLPLAGLALLVVVVAVAVLSAVQNTVVILSIGVALGALVVGAALVLRE